MPCDLSGTKTVACHLERRYSLRKPRLTGIQSFTSESGTPFRTTLHRTGLEPVTLGEQSQRATKADCPELRSRQRLGDFSLLCFYAQRKKLLRFHRNTDWFHCRYHNFKSAYKLFIVCFSLVAIKRNSIHNLSNENNILLLNMYSMCE